MRGLGTMTEKVRGLRTKERGNERIEDYQSEEMRGLRTIRFEEMRRLRTIRVPPFIMLVSD
jgi:hypothetical protein